MAAAGLVPVGPRLAAWPSVVAPLGQAQRRRQSFDGRQPKRWLRRQDHLCLKHLKEGRTFRVLPHLEDGATLEGVLNDVPQFFEQLPELPVDVRDIVNLSAKISQRLNIDPAGMRQKA